MWPRSFFRRPPTVPDRLWNAACRRLHYTAALPLSEQARLRELVQRFLQIKVFEGAAGLAVTDRMRVEIAVQACVLILHLDLDYYRDWHAVIIYPGNFVVPREILDEDGVVHAWREALAGESWERGPVILSWDASREHDPDFNVVLHEFAHKLDMANGVAHGCPPLPAEISPSVWAETFEVAYTSFCNRLDRDLPTPIDPYAAESPAEFFAVLSESFFLQPRQLQAEFPAVYKLLRGFYGQNPLAVLTGGIGGA